MLRYEIIINKSKKETKSNGNIWYKLSKNSHKRKNISFPFFDFFLTLLYNYVNFYTNIIIAYKFI